MPIIKLKHLVFSVSLLGLVSTALADPVLPTPPSQFSDQGNCAEYIKSNYLSQVDWKTAYSAFFSKFSNTCKQTKGVCTEDECTDYYCGEATTGKAYGSGCMLADPAFHDFWQTVGAELNEEVKRVNNSEPSLGQTSYAVKCTYKIDNEANKTCQLVAQAK